MQGDLLQQLLCPEKNYYDLAALVNPQRVELKNLHQMACCSCSERLRSISSPWRAGRANLVVMPRAGPRPQLEAGGPAPAPPYHSFQRTAWQKMREEGQAGQSAEGSH
ncbi:mCG148371 [Mus musculus]|nr:mCG148371 [Mus musculus]